MELMKPVLQPFQGWGCSCDFPRVGASANPGLNDGTPLAFSGAEPATEAERAQR